MAHATRAQMTKTRQNIKYKQDHFVYRLYTSAKTRIVNISKRKAIAFVLTLCVVIYTVALIITGNILQKSWSSITDYALKQSIAAGFVIDDVLITGRENIDKDWLKNSFSSVKGAPLFAVDTAKVASILARHPWVKDVTVQRLWPDKLKINITERRPVLWQIDSKNKNYLRLIDSDGNAIGLYNKSAFPTLFVVEGADANTAGLNFIPMIRAEPIIAQNTEKASYVSKRRWNLHLKNGITVMLPEKDLGLAMRKLALAEEENNLFSRPIKSIDIRNSDRIILEIKNGENEVLSLTNTGQAL